jgi:hypothetical protein
MTRDYISFTTIREDFSEFEIETGQRVRIKYMLSEVVRQTNEKGKESLSFSARDLSTVIPHFDIDTSTLEYASTDEVTEKDVVKRYKFRPVKEVINIYEIDNMIILLACKLEAIALTNKKDRTNSPIVRFTANLLFNGVRKP